MALAVLVSGVSVSVAGAELGELLCAQLRLSLVEREVAVDADAAEGYVHAAELFDQGVHLAGVGGGRGTRAVPRA